MDHPKVTGKPTGRYFPFHPSAFLLAAQSLLIILYAVFDDFSGQHALISTLSTLVLILVVWVLNHSPAIPWLTWALAVPAFSLSLLSALIIHPTLSLCSSLMEAALYFYAAVSMVAYMMGDDKVTTDELFAVGATYTLLAWGYANLYLACQLIIPGSFASASIMDRPLTFIETLFLSFTNLSTTGLSDIVPVSAWSRALMMLEQLTGVCYMAIIVSRLIGLSLQKRRSRQE